MKRLVITDAAQADLQDIARFTREQWSAEQAQRYLQDIKSRLARLRERPMSGPSREDLGKGLRSALSGRHVIFYRDSSDRIEIVRVLHGAMDVHQRLMEQSAPTDVSSVVGRSRKKPARIKRK